MEIKSKIDSIKKLNNEMENIDREIADAKEFKKKQPLFDKKQMMDARIKKETLELTALNTVLDTYLTDLPKAEESLKKLRKDEQEWQLSLDILSAKIASSEKERELKSEVSPPMRLPSSGSDIASPEEPSSPSEVVSPNISDEEVVDKDKEFKR